MQAKNGEVSAVQHLSEMIQTEAGSHHVVDALDIFLTYLDSKLIPVGYTSNPIVLQETQRALHSLMGLESLLHDVMVSSRPWVKCSTDSLVAKLILHLDDVAAWFLFVITSSLASECPSLLNDGNNVIFYAGIFSTLIETAERLWLVLHRAMW
jgi:hypothetical protein